MSHVKQPVAIDLVLGSLLHRQRLDADDCTVRCVESFDVLHGSRACRLIDRDASEVLGERQIAIRWQGRFKCQHVLQH